MADPIELTFEAKAITARYADGRAAALGDVPAAVQLLKSLVQPEMPVRITEEEPGADQLARQTADLAGMRLEMRDGRLLMLRPGKPPAPLDPPGAGQKAASARKMTRGPVMISVEPGLYNSSAAAFAAVLTRSGRTKAPQRFHDFGTDTFLKGSTSLGRVQALYKNLLDYGASRISSKLQAWVDFLHSSEDPMDRQLLGWFSAGVDPRDVDALGDRDLVMPYFKAWALLRVARGDR